MRIFAVIPAGGKGLRSGLSTPKQYLKIEDRELISYPLEVFNNNRSVDEIIIAADPSFFNLLNEIKKKYNYSKISNIIAAGPERQDSVYNALKSIKAEENDLIIVHDAARALLSQELLNNAIQTALDKGNALVCIKAKDTLLKGVSTVKEYLDRDEVYYVQTPQIFRYAVLLKAFNQAYNDNYIGTDESMLVKRIGEQIYISEGSVFNFKITSKEDIELAAMIISSADKKKKTQV